jgi:hypothetical protein
MVPRAKFEAATLCYGGTSDLPLSKISFRHVGLRHNNGRYFSNQL